MAEPLIEIYKSNNEPQVVELILSATDPETMTPKVAQQTCLRQCHLLKFKIGTMNPLVVELILNATDPETMTPKVAQQTYRLIENQNKYDWVT